MTVFQPVSKADVLNPLISPYGETVYELIGGAEQHGGNPEHSLAHINLAPGKASLKHYHRLSQESFYILNGAALMVIDEVEYPLSPGQSILIRPNQRHQIFNPGASDLEYLAVCVPAWYPEDSFYE